VFFKKERLPSDCSDFPRKDYDMLFAGSSLKDFGIDADDGRVGTISDLLFDDHTWKIRWLVIETGSWITKRTVLVHPSAVGTADYDRNTLPVRLTMAQIKASPDISEDRPVSQQVQDNLYGYYGWNPLWGGPGYFGGYPIGMGWPLVPIRSHDEGAVLQAQREAASRDEGDPHLRSFSAVISNHILASDGAIGHLENVLVDPLDWSIRYLVVDTRNWWPGQHVLISPYAVQDVLWPEEEIRLNLTRDRVRSSPAWDPAKVVDRAYEERLHGHYGWPGYGW